MESWKELITIPIKGTVLISVPVSINNDEFMVALSKNDHFSNGDGIYKFNINKNKWIKIFDYDEKFMCNIWSSAYDNDNKLLYVCDPSHSQSYTSRILIFDLNTKTKVTITEEQFKQLFGFIMIEDKLHQICHMVSSNSEMENGNHYIYNATQQFNKITTFKPLEKLFFYGLIYLKSKKAVLLCGGHKFGFVFQDSIFLFSCIDSTWKELSIKIPLKLSGFGIVATTNEQYVIILGGWCGGQLYSDHIFIYDTRNNTFSQSKIKCPVKGMYRAIIMNNSNRDEVVSYGFMRDCYKSENFINVQLLPENLTKIICCYYCYEEVYLLKKCQCTGTSEHWKISVDYILQ
eukprot:131857_1